ncbi:MAG: DNA internalization-related competence protein ComEC/Rec2 [Proteobacteria bacterium]|nr:DNA internalization-related competence protein ComEC/Rec2 [Pseudomonadota bacterium]
MQVYGAFYLAGILSALANPAPPHSTTAILLISIAAAAAVCRATRLPALALAGFAWASLSISGALDDRVAPELEGEVLKVGGVVDSFAIRRGGLVSFNLKLDDRRRDGRALPRRVALVWFDNPALPPLGAWCELYVRLKRPHAFANPGGRDLERALLVRGVGARGYVVAHPGNLCLDIAPARSLAGIRSRLSARIDAAIPDPAAAAVIKALAVSDRSGLGDEQWDVMRKTGTGHLLAISGLHVSLVAGWTFMLSRYAGGYGFRHRQSYPAIRLAWFMAVAAALAYAALAGFGVPARRAAIVVATAGFAALKGRRVLSSDNLSLALVAVVTADPLSPLSGGFWLSFCAAGILVWMGAGTHRAGFARHWRSHLALAIGIAPLAALFFGQLSLTAPVANLVAVPWCAAFVVPLTLLGVICSLLDGAIAPLLWDMAARSWLLLWRFLEYLAAVSPRLMVAGSIDAGGAVLLVLGLSILALPRGVAGRVLGILLLCTCALPRQRPLEDGEFRLEVFDVGQGLAILVQTRRHAALYDTGPRWWGGPSEAGSVVILPALKALGVDRLDAVIISHADADHASGAHAVIEAMPVQRILVSESHRSDPLPHAALCRAADGWTWDGVSFRILHPFPRDQGSRNDRSCVLAIDGSGGGALLPGDVESGGESLLLDRYGAALAAEILIVPHHGSISSSTAAFADAVRPAFAVVSAGYRNRYGFPHAQVVARYRNRGARVLNTAKQGAVRLEVGRHAIRVSTYRESGWGFWRSGGG